MEEEPGFPVEDRRAVVGSDPDPLSGVLGQGPAANHAHGLIGEDFEATAGDSRDAGHCGDPQGPVGRDQQLLDPGARQAVLAEEAFELSPVEAGQPAPGPHPQITLAVLSQSRNLRLGNPLLQAQDLERENLGAGGEGQSEKRRNGGGRDTISQ